MRICLASLSLLLAISASAMARIGETLEECEKRYGRPSLASDKNSCLFEKGPLLINVDFFEGKAGMISFLKTKKDKLGQHPPMSDAEIKVLLEANGSGLEWTEAGNTAEGRSWKTKDGERSAQYSEKTHSLVIVTVDSVKRLKEREKKALEGF